jgi:signal transduction histidine kinase/CheY-like chemotaxis protein
MASTSSPSPRSPPILPEFGLSYDEYLETHQSSKRIICFYFWHVLLLSLGILLYVFDVMKTNHQHHSGDHQIISPYTLLRFICVIPISFHLYHLLQKTYFPFKWKPQPFRLSTISNTYLLSLTIASAIALIGSSLVPPSKCNLPLCEDIVPGKIQPYLLFQNILFGILSPILVKSHSKWCPWLVYFLSFIASIISAILVEKSTTSTYFTILAIYFLGAIVVYDNEMTLRQLYHHHMTQEEHLLIKLKSLNEQEILLIKEQQLRLLFGNIAHDLKSPLQAFTMELGLLQDLLTSSSPTTSSSSSSAPRPSSSAKLSSDPHLAKQEEKFDEKLQAEKSIEILQSVCSFMLMTINRAVDYSKVSSGINLVPSLKVTNLPHTLSWVLRCVGSSTTATISGGKLQQQQDCDEVPILIEPFPSNLCLNILTDPQWLRENLLCLVSNAQKFTSFGKITIRCLLEAKGPELLTSLFSNGISQRSSQNFTQKFRNSSQKIPFLHFSPTLAASESGPVGGLEHNSTSQTSSAPAAPPSAGAPTGGGDGSGHGLVSTSPAQFLRIEVEDTGIGIEPHKRTEIFQPLKPSSDHSPPGSHHSHSGGTGLGLFSLFNRVQSLGGHCGVTPRRDRQQGSCFWFTVPYHPNSSSTWPSLSPRASPLNRVAPPAPTPADKGGMAFVLEDISSSPSPSSSSPLLPPALTGPSSRSHSNLRQRSFHSLSSLPPHPSLSSSGETPSDPHFTTPLKILLVEDSILIQKTTSRALAKAGYDVEIARHGEECLEMTLKKRYDCLLMDINMPVMDGIEATKKIREREMKSLSPPLLPHPHDLPSCPPTPWPLASLSPISLHLQPRSHVAYASPFPDPEECLPSDPSPPPPPLCIIGFSANGDSNTIAQALEAGMNDFLLKPLSMKDFQECFHRLRSSSPSPLSCSLP